uniref:Uncharacterized protein n=1 Tax=Anopheles dirus TaxID=7168 RepID=A0A182NWI9_9DIPT
VSLFGSRFGSLQALDQSDSTDRVNGTRIELSCTGVVTCLKHTVIVVEYAGLVTRELHTFALESRALHNKKKKNVVSSFHRNPFLPPSSSLPRERHGT